MNDELRSAMIQRGVTVEQLARECEVDPKTVGRWISTGRTPHPRHRRTVATTLRVPVGQLWPTAANRDPYLRPSSRSPDIDSTYADRASVPRDTWPRLLRSASSNIDILVFSGTFLTQTNPSIAGRLIERASDGAQVRLCFGDPSGAAVKSRDQEEGLHHTLGAKIRASLSYFTKLVDTANCEVRLHDTTLYAGIFRYDDQAIINPHIWGRPASANPAIHVRRIGNDCTFDKYMGSFNAVWQRATPWRPDAAPELP
ncbi:MAG: XRE family transcriptional regulator [Haloechinothrix sp.]